MYQSTSMSSLRRCLAIASLLLLLPAVAGAQGGDADGPLLKDPALLRQNAMNAWKNKDAATLTNTMAPDFHFVSPQGIATRDMWLGSLPHCSVASYSIDQAQAYRISPDSAVLIFKLHYVGDCDGTPNPTDSIVTDTFVQRKGKWWMTVA